MKIFILFTALLMTSVDILADDIQWSQGFDINCTNAIHREDETPLAVSEIASIKYYAFAAGDQTTPQHIYISEGPCKSFHINT